MGIADEIKNTNLNPEEAVKTLSKTQNTAIFIISMFVVLGVLGVIVWLAAHLATGRDAKLEQEEQRLEAKQAQDEAKYDALLARFDSLRSVEIELRDSLARYKIFHEFNITSGEKQIILIPKKSESQ